MRYTLPDGKSILLEEVVRISRVRDLGEDESSIEYSKLSFNIYLNGEHTIEVNEKYHFADWPDKKRKLSQLRNDLVSRWKQVAHIIDDD